MDKKIRMTQWVCAALMLILLSGCAGSVKNMREVPPGEAQAAPAPDKSMVVFMRPSGMGFAIQSSVFEVDGDEVTLAGIVASKRKVAYEVEPGEHLFMVVGESADFMSADLDAGKVYYVLVTPRMGVWKARFSLKPVHAGELGGAEFREWLESCSWVEKTAESEKWAASNMESIQEKRETYYKKWMDKAASERPALQPQDGIRP